MRISFVNNIYLQIGTDYIFSETLQMKDSAPTAISWARPLSPVVVTSDSDPVRKSRWNLKALFNSSSSPELLEGEGVEEEGEEESSRMQSLNCIWTASSTTEATKEESWGEGAYLQTCPARKPAASAAPMAREGRTR